ncbi:PREDICTED: zygote arrest protein 1 [Condylura cristata]|uniref:zygote arrest protein 1 n=1 Tax=Condylura cristata TaxID=143302 RepID=UPI0003344B82|nr:PREDICTED: zygote arrest protein 1 [Condylura cristata]
MSNVSAVKTTVLAQSTCEYLTMLNFDLYSEKSSNRSAGVGADPQVQTFHGERVANGAPSAGTLRTAGGEPGAARSGFRGAAYLGRGGGRELLRLWLLRGTRCWTATCSRRARPTRGAEAAAGERGPGAPEEERGPPPSRPRSPEEGEESARKAARQRPSEEEEAAAAPAARQADWGPREAGGDEAVSPRASRTPEQPTVGRTQDVADGRSSPRSLELGRERLRFQFLEQKYGYYHCKDCNIRWESAYVWCVQGTNKVYFKQFCRTCQKSYNPYRVEDITCQSCKQTRCSCSVKLRHVDPKRPHRQDLCGRCKGKRLSCDSTFSFKYII